MTQHEDEFEGRPHLVGKRARAEFASRLVQYVWTMLLVLILALVFISIRANNQDRDNLIDCTTKSGRCYQESQKQTGLLIDDLVSRINDNSSKTRNVIVIALWCDDRPEVKTIPQLVSCINEGLKKYGDLSIRGEETHTARKQ